MTGVQTTDEDADVATLSPELQGIEDCRNLVAFYQQIVSRPDLRAVLTELAAYERDE